MAAMAGVWLVAIPPACALTLAQAVAAARANSLSVQAGQQRLAGAEESLAATQGTAWPTLALQTTGSYNHTGFAFGGGTVVGFPINGPAFDNTLSVSQPVFNGGGLQANIAVARSQRDQQQDYLILAQQEAMASASIAYFEVLRDQALAATAQMAYQQAQQHLSLSRLQLRAGTGTRAAMLQFRAQLANAQDALTSAQNAAAIAQLDLANALNVPLSALTPLATASVPAFPVALDRELTGALGRRPDIQAQLRQQDIDASRVTLAKSTVWPDLSLEGRYSQRDLYPGEAEAGLGMTWTVFDGRQQQHQAEAAKHLEAADRAELTALEQSTQLAIESQYRNREEAAVRLAAAQSGLSAAQTSYQITLDRYRLGLASVFELTDAQTTLIQAQTNAVQSEYDEDEASIRLAEALGYDLGQYLGSS